MTEKARFENAWPYQGNIVALPVTDIDVASKWYCNAFGMMEITRSNEPTPTVILERNGVKIGYSTTGGDASQNGAAILVTDIEKIRAELESGGANPGEVQFDERDGEKFAAVFVVAPDQLCYYFHQKLAP